MGARRKFSPEHCKKISAALKKRHQENPEEHRRIGLVQRGKIVSQETREKLSKAHMGNKHSPESKEKIRVASLGRKRSPESIERSAAAHRGSKRTPETRKKMRLSHLGKKLPLETRKKMSQSRLGMSPSPETREKISQAQLGSKSSNWKGGITPENDRLRDSLESREWRRQVYGRDWYTCQACGLQGVGINAHHIKPWHAFPELRYEIDNGITLCKKCHKIFPGTDPDTSLVMGVVMVIKLQLMLLNWNRRMKQT